MDVFDLVAKIRLDASEYEGGVGKARNTFSTLASGIKTGLTTVAKVGGAAVAAGVAGVTALTKMGVESYAQYEQLAGGVETLFKESGAAVMAYAENAYKTSGLSANAYLETATSFSASLIRSLEGDTAKAAQVADQAITDMSDNANKMGTSIEMIQNAYNGFAKGNYTMLDNLKLGYGGTREEMQRLLEDATAISGIEYDISSFADVSEAIHVIQQDLEISGISYEEAMQRVANGEMTMEEATAAMGTTAREAATTIEGSISMMKGAWSNLVVGMADDKANMEVLINNFVESTATAAQNLIPRIEQTLVGIGQVITALAPVISEALPTLIASVLPSLLTAGVSLITAVGEGIAQAAPAVLQAALDAVTIILVDGFGVSAETASGFVGTLEAAIQAVGDTISWVSNNIETVMGVLSALGVAIGVVVTAIGAYNAVQAIKAAMDAAEVTTLGALIAAQLAHAAAAIAAVAPYVLIVAAIAAVIAIIVVCVKHWDDIKAAVANAWDFIVEKVSAAVEAVVGFFTNMKENISNKVEEIKTAMSEKWSSIKETISTKASEIKENVSEKFGAMKENISAKITAAKEICVAIFEAIRANIQSKLQAAKQLVTTIFDGIKASIQNKIETAKSIISNTLGLIKAIFSGDLGAAKQSVLNIFDSIKTGISNKIENAKTTVQNAINAIKGFFNFEWSLPHIKLPHFSVSGGEAPWGFGGKGSLPSVGVSWYRKAYDNAMVLSKPTIFGYSNGSFLGGGDGTGNEIVSGESHLMGIIGHVVQSTTAAQNEQIVSLLSALLEATVNGNTETVRALMADRKWAVGEREFARLVRMYA